jgi:PIN domain nuclease of toxin-antitoxin system
MRILIDTHVFIWAVIDSKKLNRQMRRVLLEASEVFVSSASVWEIAIKVRLGKLEGDPFKFVTAISQSGFHELPISAHHAAKVSELPLYHRDPFDRLLIAQALYESLQLLTTDSVLCQYSDLVMKIPLNKMKSVK